MPKTPLPVALLALLPVAASFALASDAPPELVLTLRTDQDSYDLASEITFEVHLTNSGQEPIIVFGRLLWGRTGGITLHVRDEGGSMVHGRFLDHDTLVPTWLSEPANYVSLNPGHFLGVSRVDRVADLVPEPGRYEVFVEYQSPVPEKFAPSPGFWSRERGVIRSASIPIEVAAAHRDSE